MTVAEWVFSFLLVALLAAVIGHGWWPILARVARRRARGRIVVDFNGQSTGQQVGGVEAEILAIELRARQTYGMSPLARSIKNDDVLVVRMQRIDDLTVIDALRRDIVRACAAREVPVAGVRRIYTEVIG